MGPDGLAMPIVTTSRRHFNSVTDVPLAAPQTASVNSSVPAPGRAGISRAAAQVAPAASSAPTATAGGPLDQIREVLSQSVASSSVTLNTGAGTQVGDQLVCIRMTDAYTDSSVLGSPTGTAGVWAQQGSDIGASGSVPRIRVWTRTVAVAGAQTVTCASSGARANHVILYVMPAGRSVNAVQTAYGTGTGTTRDAPTVTASSVNTTLVCCGTE